MREKQRKQQFWLSFGMCWNREETNKFIVTGKKVQEERNQRETKMLPLFLFGYAPAVVYCFCIEHVKYRQNILRGPSKQYQEQSIILNCLDEMYVRGIWLPV